MNSIVIAEMSKNIRSINQHLKVASFKHYAGSILKNDKKPFWRFWCTYYLYCLNNCLNLMPLKKYGIMNIGVSNIDVTVCE